MGKMGGERLRRSRFRSRESRDEGKIGSSVLGISV